MTGITIFITLLIGIPLWLIYSLLLKWSAKGVGKIETATFKNTALIVLLSSIASIIIFVIITYITGMGTLLSNSMVFIILLIIIWSITYIPFGKLIWKCEWIQSIKANMVLFIIAAIIMFIMLNINPPSSPY